MFVSLLTITTFIQISTDLHQILHEKNPLKIDDYVVVNKRNYSYVIAINNNNTDIKVKYTITNTIQDISVYDCQIGSFVSNTNLCSGYERHDRTAPHILPNNT